MQKITDELRLLFVSPDAAGVPIRCPSCDCRWFDAGKRLSGTMEQKCRRCGKLWNIVFFLDKNAYFSAKRDFLSIIKPQKRST